MDFFIAFFIAIVGLVVGSFLNVVIYRLPRHESLSFPSSHCPQCDTPLFFWENIPVISWLVLRGKCRTCKKRISFHYPLVELFTSAISVLAYEADGLTIKLGFSLLFLWMLTALSVIDINTLLLPNKITKPGMLIGFIASLSFYIQPSMPITTPIQSILGIILGYGVLWGVSAMYKKIRGVEGMGGGDFKLLGMIGAWIGWENMFYALFIGVLGAFFFSIYLILIGKGKTVLFPFGPFLAFGGAILILYPVTTQVIIAQIF